MIDHAQGIPGDDHQRKAAFASQIGHVELVSQRRQQTASPFHHNDIGSLTPIVETAQQQFFIQFATFSPRGQVRSQRSEKPLGADPFEFARRAGRLPQGQGIVGHDLAVFFAATAGDRFINADAMPADAQLSGDKRADVGLAYIGVGACNE